MTGLRRLQTAKLLRNSLRGGRFTFPHGHGRIGLIPFNLTRRACARGRTATFTLQRAIFDGTSPRYPGRLVRPVIQLERSNVRFRLPAPRLRVPCVCPPHRVVASSPGSSDRDSFRLRPGTNRYTRPDIESGGCARLPVSGVNVAIKESWESWQTRGGGIKEADKADYRQRWASDFVPWLKAVTDAQGRAVVTIRETALDWTKGNQPPPNRDWVSNREYLIKLQGKNGQDDLRLVMKPGASAKGSSHTVTVIDIENPRYVPTRQ